MKGYRIELFCRTFILVGCLALAVGPLFAHHGRGATYDVDQEISVAGIVAELAWRNPHVAVYLDVTDENGEVVRWGFEVSNVSTMTRQGWTRNSFKPGQEITITYNPARSGAPIGVLKKATFPDGTLVGSRGDANTID